MHPKPPDPPRLLDQVRQACRLRHYSPRTEEAYCLWIRRFILFHNKQHPRTLGSADVTTFLSSLATRDEVSASTQNQALCALLFLYRSVLAQPLPETLDGLVRARTPATVPTVLTRSEVRATGGGYPREDPGLGDEQAGKSNGRGVDGAEVEPVVHHTRPQPMAGKQSPDATLARGSRQARITTTRLTTQARAATGHSAWL